MSTNSHYPRISTILWEWKATPRRLAPPVTWRVRVQEGEKKETRLPQQDVIRDTSTSGGAETSKWDVLLACAATSSRSRRSDMNERYGCRVSA